MKGRLRYLLVWLGYTCFVAYALSYALTYFFALLNGFESPLIGINLINEIWVEVPLFAVSVPCMGLALLDIRSRLMSQRKVVFTREISMEETA